MKASVYKTLTSTALKRCRDKLSNSRERLSDSLHLYFNTHTMLTVSSVQAFVKYITTAKLPDYYLSKQLIYESIDSPNKLLNNMESPLKVYYKIQTYHFHH